MNNFVRRHRSWAAVFLAFACGGFTWSPDRAWGEWTLGTPIVTYFAGPALTNSNAQQMTEGGWNLVWANSLAELNVAQANGLRAMWTGSLDDATVTQIRAHPALFSYYLVDEPSAAQFASLGATVAHLRALDPVHMSYINLFPNYASNAQLGASGYQEYLTQYMNVVKPDLLSYDNYQFYNGSDAPDYFKNLAIISHTAKQAGIPFLNIVQASSWDPAIRVPTAKELQFLTYTTLAYGGQGISDFVYSAPGFTTGGGMVLADGSPTPLYSAAKTLNPQFVAIAEELQSLQHIGAYHLGDLPWGFSTTDGSSPMRLPGNSPFSLSPNVANTNYVTGAPVKGAVLGLFGPSDYVSDATRTLVVNLDYTKSFTTTVTGPGNLSVFDPTTGVWSPTGQSSTTLTLSPGGGTLVGLTASANLRLSVNPYSGEVLIQNTSTASVALDGYQITSASGMLLPDATNTQGVGWDSLTDVGQIGWSKILPTSNALSELNLSSFKSIAAGASLSLGHAFTPFGAKDIAWGYSVHDLSGAEVVTQPGVIQYVDGVPFLRLSINPYSGVVTIQNSAPTTVALDGYQITSALGRLAPDATNTPGVGWDSLTDGGRTGWIEVFPKATALSELNLGSSTALAPGESLTLGRAFLPLGARDVAWGYSIRDPGGAEIVTQPGAVQYVGGLQLQVIKVLGAGNSVEGTQVVLVNPESILLNFDGYTVSSISGSLNPAGFNGLTGHGAAGWISVAPSPSALSELNLSGMKSFGSGQGQVLGAAFIAGGTHDLALEWHLVGSGKAVETGAVVYVVRLAGDVNADGVVNIFDINAVSSTWATSSLNGDANFDRLVNIFDINVISSHWGNTLASNNLVVPEPSTAALMLLGLLATGGSAVWQSRLRCRRVFRPMQIAIVAAAAMVSFASSPSARAVPIGNPSAANGWSTTSAVSIRAHSGHGSGRDVRHLIDGGGITGPLGDQHVTSSADGLGPNGFATFADFRSPPPQSNGIGASLPNPGTLEGAGSHWVEFAFDKVYTLNDVAIWNDNQAVYDQGWKHLAIQVSTTGGTNANDWTTIFNGILPPSPGPGIGEIAAHNPGSTTLPAAVLPLGEVQAKYVSFVNMGLGEEGSYLKEYNGLSDPYNAVLSEVRFNSSLTAGSPPPPLDPNRPLITYSLGPGVTDANAQQMLDGGWNLVWVNNLTELNSARAHALRAMWSGPLDDATVNQIRTNPGLYGYFVADEPGASQFNYFASIVAHLRQLDPQHVSYINLLPSYNSNATLQANSYQQYLSQYMDAVNPSILSYDFSPFRTFGDLPDYFRNLAIISHTAKQAGIPFLTIVQAASWDPEVRVPTANELRYQTYTTLVYGAQGISHYVYWAAGHQGGMALVDGTPTPLYMAAQSLNAEFESIATQLRSLKSIGAYHLGDLPPGWGTTDGSSPMRLPGSSPFQLATPTPDSNYVTNQPVKGVVLGLFGQRSQLADATHSLVVNLDYINGLTTTVTGPGDLSTFDPTTSIWTPTGHPWATLDLPPGGGVLVRLTDDLQVHVITLLGNHGDSVEATQTLLMNHESSRSLDVDGYVISSASGSLSPADFNGFAGHGIAGWSSISPSLHALSELNLTSSTLLASGALQVLGSAFTAGAGKDLTLQFHLVGGGVEMLDGAVLYRSVLAGDVNDDGVVNVFDINLISSNWGAKGPMGDGNYDGVMNIFDINFVSSHWSNTLGGSAAIGASVPEPSAIVLCAVGLCVGCFGFYPSNRWRRHFRGLVKTS